MAEQPLAEMVEIAVRELTSETQAVQRSSPAAEDEDANPTGKRRRVEAEEGEDDIQTLLYAASKTLCLRLDTIEAHLNSMEEKCKGLRTKVDLLANQNALRPLLAEQAASASLPRKSCQGSGDSAEAAPTPRDGTMTDPQQEGGPGEGQQQALGPGVHIVALCAEGSEDQGEAEEEEEEEQVDGGVALLPDASKLLYQLMY